MAVPAGPPISYYSVLPRRHCTEASASPDPLIFERLVYCHSQSPVIADQPETIPATVFFCRSRLSPVYIRRIGSRRQASPLRSRWTSLCASMRMASRSSAVQHVQKHHWKLLNITRSESFTLVRPIAICLPSGEKENVAVCNGSVSKWVICVALLPSKG